MGQPAGQMSFEGENDCHLTYRLTYRYEPRTHRPPDFEDINLPIYTILTGPW